MVDNLKKPEADLRRYYILFLEIGLLAALTFFIAAFNLQIKPGERKIDLASEKEVIHMEQIEQTEQQERPPAPPRPPVPVAVPNDVIIENDILNIDAELNIDQRLELPAAPPSEESEPEEDFFVAVEQMPYLKGGLANLQKCVKYPELASQAGIEGRVIVRFIVNEKGEVEDPQVVRGIGGGADEEALRCVKQAEFEPGRQRDVPVRVQYTLPVVFRLQK